MTSFCFFFKPKDGHRYIVRSVGLGSVNKSRPLPGPATILANVKGDEVREYDIEILKVSSSSADGRDLVLSVTDPALLEVTGGIVQGMSGSPILQGGQLVGAVTHVLLNDPTKGYGILIENMLEAAESE